MRLAYVFLGAVTTHAGIYTGCQTVSSACGGDYYGHHGG